MQEQAYDFSLFEQQAPQAPQKKQPAALRSVAGGKKKTTALQDTFATIGNLLICAAFLALAVLLIQSKVRITELTAQVQQSKEDLTKSQSTYNYLNNELNSKTNMASVEEIANRLGLMKADQSQYTYVRLEDGSVLTKETTPIHRWTDWLRSGALSFMEYLDP